MTPTNFVVVHHDRQQLQEGVEGLDLTSGQHVTGVDSHVEWSNNRLQVSGFTTLGATVLDDTELAAVRPARLATARYVGGHLAYFFSRSELPVGRVLAVHIADRIYAKLSVVRYGPGDAELRWVTYRAP